MYYSLGHKAKLNIRPSAVLTGKLKYFWQIDDSLLFLKQPNHILIPFSSSISLPNK